MITQARWAGGYVEASLSSGTYDIRKPTKIHKVTPTTSGLSATLPNAQDPSLSLGGPHFWLWNGSGAENLTLKNFVGTTLETLTPGQVAIISLYANPTTGGVWQRVVKTKMGP